MPSFREQVQTFAVRTGIRADVVLRKVALDLFTDVVLRTPVDTGRLRANWNVGLNRVDRRQRAAPAKNATGTGAPLAPGEHGDRTAAILGAARTDVVYISNNLVYAQPIDRGHSRQAPAGMTRPALQRAVQNIQAHLETLGSV